MERGFHSPRDPPTTPLPSSDPCRNAGSASARENSAALANRSAGTFSSARAMVASTFAGIDGRSAEAAVGFPLMIFPRIACAVLPVYGGSPTSIS